MYGYESWTIKKANSRRIDAFELWCWRRLLRVPWTARRLNQSILKEIIPEYPLEGLLLKLKLQYFVPMMQSWLIRKDPNSGNYWEQEKKGRTEDETVGWHTTTHVSEHEFEQTPGDSEGQEVWVAAVHGVAQLDKSERPNNWSFRYILLWTAFCIFVVFTFFLQSICLFFFFFAYQRTLKSLLQHQSSKASILRCSALSIVQISHPYMTIGKTIALTSRTFVGKGMSLLFNMLSRLAITFLPKSKRLLISWLWSPSICSDFGAPKIESVTVSTISLSICH